MEVLHKTFKEVSPVLPYMDFAIAKMSSKGQIVIPKTLREGLFSGDEFLVVREGNSLVLKKVSELAKALKEDLIFAKRTEEAWKEYDYGKFVTTSKEDFLDELEKC